MDRYEVSYVNDEATLEARMRPLEGNTSVLLQQYHAGEGHGVELLSTAAAAGRLPAPPSARGPDHGRRERAARERAGRPALLEHSLALMRELSWTGLAMVEFRVGPPARS